MDFDGFSWKINEISWIFTISQGFLGNLGVYLIRPPKMCAGLARRKLQKAPVRTRALMNTFRDRLSDLRVFLPRVPRILASA